MIERLKVACPNDPTREKPLVAETELIGVFKRL
jgi:hypothetical protein